MSSGRFESEVIPVETSKGWVHADTIIRGDTSEAATKRCLPHRLLADRETAV